jgi:hypothetical protein
MPAACPVLQQNPETDWMYTAAAGGCGRGLTDGNAASIMIGEKAAEMIAADHGVHLKEFTGPPR